MPGRSPSFFLRLIIHDQSVPALPLTLIFYYPSSVDYATAQFRHSYCLLTYDYYLLPRSWILIWNFFNITWILPFFLNFFWNNQLNNFIWLCFCIFFISRVYRSIFSQSSCMLDFESLKFDCMQNTHTVHASENTRTDYTFNVIKYYYLKFYCATNLPSHNISMPNSPIQLKMFNIHFLTYMQSKKHCKQVLRSYCKL